jgi:hypothetical protein
MADDYPFYPGSRGIDTSEAAADQIAPVSGRLRKLVLTAVSNAGYRGLTADEAAELLNIDHLSIRPRTSELRAQGLIRDSGYRRFNAGMKKMIVWIATVVAP